jgi:hypothetical protein
MDGSRVTTLLVGGLTVGIGAVGVLAGLGVLPRGQGDPTIPAVQQQALALCIGVVFAAGGAAAMLSALPGRWSSLAQRLLGLPVIAGLTLLLGWVSIGPGARAFSSPLAIFGPVVNAVSGRIMFGFGALMGLLIAVLTIRALRRPAPSTPT